MYAAATHGAIARTSAITQVVSMNAMSSGILVCHIQKPSPAAPAESYRKSIPEFRSRRGRRERPSTFCSNVLATSTRSTAESASLRITTSAVSNATNDAEREAGCAHPTASPAKSKAGSRGVARPGASFHQATRALMSGFSSRRFEPSPRATRIMARPTFAVVVVCPAKRRLSKG